MKVLFYSPVNLQAGGGCERWHCDITNSLRKQYGYDIEIVTGNLAEIRWDETYLHEQLQGIPYTRLDYLKIYETLIPTPTIIWQLYKAVKSADVVHMIYGFMGQDILMAVLKLVTGKKIVIGHHAPTFHASAIHNLYMKYISRYLMNYFDAHQTLNKKDKLFFEKEWRIRNVHFIPSGVRIEKFLKVNKSRHKGLVFLSVGRYAHQKGIDLQLQAIEKFNKENPHNKAEFLFVGSGELGNEINQFAKRYANIKNIGFVKYESLPELYAKSDIYLSCSREEPFGLVLIEAWSSGIPVLATKTEGPLDMIRENENGWFISEISVECICKAITKTYYNVENNSQLLNGVISACRMTGTMYSIDQTAQRMSKILFKY